PGDYTVTYSVTDSHGNTASANRTVRVTPNNPPSITLLGDNPQLILQGSPYVEQGATANDPEDGDLTDQIVTDSSAVDTNTPGDYTVTYSVTDTDGNNDIAERIVRVRPNNPPSITLLGDD